MIDRELLKKYSDSFGISLDETAFDRFDKYAEALVETNKYLNLTAITDTEGVTVKHFADSLSVFSVFNPESGNRILDVGTGAGFPGSVIQMARPDVHVTLLDGTQKKLRFISDTLRTVGLSAETVHMRAEEAGQNPSYRETFDYVTARAVANLRELCEYCLPFVKIGGSFIAMKSVKTDEEIDEAEKAIELLGGKIDRIHSFQLGDAGERTLIIIKKISHTPPKYPRPSAKIAKQPIK